VRIPEIVAKYVPGDKDVSGKRHVVKISYLAFGTPDREWGGLPFATQAFLKGALKSGCGGRAQITEKLAGEMKIVLWN